MPFALDDLDSNCRRLGRIWQIAEGGQDLCEHGGICVGRHDGGIIYRVEATASRIELLAVRTREGKCN